MDRVERGKILDVELGHRAKGEGSVLGTPRVGCVSPNSKVDPANGFQSAVAHSPPCPHLLAGAGSAFRENLKPSKDPSLQGSGDQAGGKFSLKLLGGCWREGFSGRFDGRGLSCPWGGHHHQQSPCFWMLGQPGFSHCQPPTAAGRYVELGEREGSPHSPASSHHRPFISPIIFPCPHAGLQGLNEEVGGGWKGRLAGVGRARKEQGVASVQMLGCWWPACS